MEKLESVQCNAALAMTSAIRGTDPENTGFRILKK